MTFTDPDADPLARLKRDHYGRPLVIPPDGGKAIGYTRATTIAGCIDDKSKIAYWQMRMVALGILDQPTDARRAAMLLQIEAARDDKRKLDEVCEQLKDMGGGNVKREQGTALHKLCEKLDKGLELGTVPTEYQGDIGAYAQATAHLTPHAIEEFTVLDEFTIGGTPDRIVELPDGRMVIADIKTGSIEYSGLTIAVQLAIYAHSQHYDQPTNTRRSLGPIDLDTAIVIHLPGTEGVCTLVEVDIAAGWEALPVAVAVHTWRKRRDLLRAHAPAAVPAPLVAVPDAPVDPLANEVASATSVDQLIAIWERERPRGKWSPRLTQLAAERKSRILKGGAA